VLGSCDHLCDQPRLLKRPKRQAYQAVIDAYAAGDDQRAYAVEEELAKVEIELRPAPRRVEAAEQVARAARVDSPPSAASGNVCALDHLTQHSILRGWVAPGDVAPDQEGLGLVALVVRAVETEVRNWASMQLSQLAECGCGGYLRA
jgi:hypothetical protein